MSARIWRDIRYAPERAFQVVPREPRAIARTTGRLPAIRDLLERDSTSLEIVRYLLRHTGAADTPRGIADWWIGRDLQSTVDALAQLERHGVVRSCLVQDASAVYVFTKNPLLREALRQYVETRTAALERA
jgi:hypothetical protein